MATSITTSNFSSRLSAWVKSAGSMRQGAQDIIVFGMERYQATGDAGYLTRLYQAAVNITGLNATRMKRYIVAHANVHLTKAKDGQWVFSKTGKGANEAKPLAGNWWEWEVQRAPSTKFDLAARILSVANALEKAIDDPTITVSTADVDAALASLKSAIAKAQRRPDLKLAA